MYSDVLVMSCAVVKHYYNIILLSLRTVEIKVSKVLLALGLGNVTINIRQYHIKKHLHSICAWFSPLWVMLEITEQHY